MAFFRILAVVAVFLAVPRAADNAVAAEAAAVHHEVSVRLDPKSREMRVEDRFKIEADGAMVFGLAPWLSVVEARVNGKAVAAVRDGHRVRLPAALAGPQTVEVTLKGLVPQLPGSDGPAVPGRAAAGKEGGYLPGYADWMPDTGGDGITYTLAVEVPTPYRVVATGRLVTERLDEKTYRASFAADIPAEAPSLFAGPYVIGERREGDLRLRTYFHPELAPLAEDYMRAAAAYIRGFGARIGPYPYADFHIVSAPLPVGLGFPNLTYVGRRVLPLPFMRGRSLAHEILHSWWGNAVAVDYATGNWAEGLTTYLADYAVVEEQGAAAARKMRLGWLQNYAALPAERDLAVERFVVKGHDAAQVIGYDKVAFVFRMLEAEIGEAAFAAGLRQFWETHRFRRAAWSDLRTAFEAAAGRDLGWFFDQWLKRAGAPRIELASAQRRQRDDGYRMTLTLRQDAPPYRLRVPIVVETTGGLHRETVALDRSKQMFELATSERPRVVRIDPDFEVFRKLLPGESPPIFRDVTLSPKTVLVLATDDPEMAKTAYRLAGRLLQRRPTVHAGDARSLKSLPVLAIGATKDIDALRRRAGPVDGMADAAIVESVGAKAWIDRRPDGTAWLFVAADDAQALAALARPLPHYRSQSYVIFDGAKATARGVWQVNASPLSRRLGQ